MTNLHDWVVEWLYTYKRIMIKPSTFDSYLQYATNINCFVSLDELATSDIQKLINDMVVNKKQLSTIKHMLTLVRQSLKKAYSLKLVSSLDCLNGLELPRGRPKTVKPFTDQQLSLIKNNAFRTYYGDFYLALLYTGCRVGELIALRWTDVDFFNGCIYISHTDYHGDLISVKTEHGVRCLPFTEPLKEILFRRFSEQKNERVFCNTLGRPIKYRTLLDNWHWFCSQIGLYDPLGFHVFRHTFAHIALRQGIPVKVVSSWLGHSDVRITLQIYDSVSSNDMISAASALTAAFG